MIRYYLSGIRSIDLLAMKTTLQNEEERKSMLEKERDGIQQEMKNLEVRMIVRVIVRVRVNDDNES